MMTVSELTELLGWISVINIFYLLLATLIVKFMRGVILSIHSHMFNLDEETLSAKYFDFLSIYKIVTLVFCVAPYIALKIMGH